MQRADPNWTFMAGEGGGFDPRDGMICDDDVGEKNAPSHGKKLLTFESRYLRNLRSCIIVVVVVHVLSIRIAYSATRLQI